VTAAGFPRYAAIWCVDTVPRSLRLSEEPVQMVLSNDQRAHAMEQAVQRGPEPSKDRRFGCYSDFVSHARAYRGAVSSLSQGQTDHVQRLDELAAAADATSSLVFLVLQSVATYDACRSVLKAIRECQALAHQPVDPDASVAQQLEDTLAVSLREFQASSREELGVTGVERWRILTSSTQLIWISTLT
jgi:hypothetical protein